MGAKAKYTQYGPEMLELYKNGKNSSEISIILKEKYNDDVPSSSIRSIIKRQLEQQELEEVEPNPDPDIKQEQLELFPDQTKETIDELFLLFEAMEGNHSRQKETALLQEKSLNNLAELEAKYEDGIEKHSILIETLHETITQNKEARRKNGNPYLTTSGCILTLTLAMVVGYYSRRYNNYVSFHYIVVSSYILGGVIAGIGLGVLKKKITAMWQKTKSK